MKTAGGRGGCSVVYIRCVVIVGNSGGRVAVWVSPPSIASIGSTG